MAKTAYWVAKPRCGCLAVGEGTDAAHWPDPSRSLRRSAGVVERSKKEASADWPWPLCFLLYGAGLLTGSPVYAVRATFQAMSTVRMGCLLLVEAVAVVTGSDGIAIFTGRHALDPASRIRIL